MKNKITFNSILAVAAACIIYGVMQGVHDNYGILMTGLIPVTSLSYAQISFCIGVGAMLYGLVQPFLGMIALKKSPMFVITFGIIFMITGLIVTPLCRSFITLLLFFGILLPLGTTGLCFGIVMSAITPIIGEKKAAAVSGIVQASAGIGDALMSPLLQSLSASIGIRYTMFLLCVPLALMGPIVIMLSRIRRQESSEIKTSSNVPMKDLLTNAFKQKDYRLVLAGFATCGFNMSIIESHLYSQYISYGISPATASLTLTVYGIFTMLGAVMTGFLSTKFKMKNVLGSVYFSRVLISLGFIFLPKNAVFAFLATACLGMSGDSTVPPTSGIVTRLFGSDQMPVLYGFALIGHQFGAFLSAYLGGLFVSLNLGYTPLWIINMLLAGFAAFESYRIRCA